MNEAIRKVPKAVVILTAILFGAVLALRIAPSLLGGRNADGGVQTFKTGSVTKGTYEQTVSSTGTLTAVGTVEIGTQVSGTVSEILVDYNDRVVKNQILAILDQSSYEAAVTVAEASVQMKEAELAQARAEYDRYLPLFEAGHLSEEEFLAYRTVLKTAEASLRQAQAELERDRIDLDHTVIRSPIDGTVIERSVDGGQTVAASLSSPTLFIIAKDLSSMEIEVSVDENDIGMIQNGQEVRFTVPAFVDDVFTGSVSTIRLNSQVVSNVVNYTVIVKVEDTRGILLPGMTATVDFIIEKIKDALLVPSAALRLPTRTVSGDISDALEQSAPEPGEALFVVAPTGQTHLVRVLVLGDNGSVCVIEPGGRVKEGDMVATGLNTVGGSSPVKEAGGIASRLMPSPPGGRK